MEMKLSDFIKNEIKAEKIEINEKNINELLELYLDNDFINSMALIKSAYQDCGISKTISNAFFFKKFINFLYGIKDVPLNYRTEFLDGLGEIQENKFIEKLIIFIEKYDDFEKCKYLSKLFIGLIYKKIDLTIFMRLCISLENIYAEDIKLLILSNDTQYVGGIGAPSLANANLAYISSNNSLESENSYMISSLGNILCDILA